MNYNVGTRLRIEGRFYDIIGKIQYQNTADRCVWHEYRLISCDDGREYWLSADDVYREYSISSVVRTMPYADGYHEVDRGTERVLASWGNVDVDPGETAQFTEYEDQTEEKIISVEKWSDGKEFSTGYYLDADEIEAAGSSPAREYSSGYSQGYSSQQSSKLVSTVVTLVMVMIFAGPFIIGLGGTAISVLADGYVPSVSKMLRENTYRYSYVTSVTGTGGQKADVYSVLQGTAQEAATAVINYLDGKTEDVMQNTEDDDESIAILTKKEYCLIYESEDNEVLIQVSGRKYVFSTDEEPYHSRQGTHRFYRRHYHTRAYRSDYNRFRNKISDSFSGFSDSDVGSSSSDSLNTYSGTLRQQSINSRTSSGGGTNYGK